MYKNTWGKRAFRIFVRQWRWEGDSVGKQAAETMRKNVANAILRIQQMPSVGRLHTISGKIKHIESYKHIPRVLYSTGIMNMKSILSDS